MLRLASKNKTLEQQLRMRETLFGDDPIEEWGNHDDLGEPWSTFTRAKKALEAADVNGAVEALQTILCRQGLESRHYLEALDFLRQLGVKPPETIRLMVFGVVAEVMLEPGLDLLAAYEDASARYFNHSGAAVIWDKPDDSLLTPVLKVVAAASFVVGELDKAGLSPIPGHRPGPPPVGFARFSFLAGCGRYECYGPMKEIESDAWGDAVFSAALELMQELTKKHA